VSGRRNRTRAQLAQNLFANEASARTLVGLAGTAPGDRVYDLGAGSGAVTEALLRAGARVVAVERDPNLAHKLRARFAGRPVTVVEADLREVRFRPPFKVVANPPFNLTADLLRRLLEGVSPPDAATLVLQREAAERCAGVRRLSAVALEALPWFDLSVARPFARHDFTPRPSVDVAVLRIVRRPAPDLGEPEREAWRAFVRQALARPRPDAWHTFRGLVSNLQWRRLSTDLGIEPGALRANLSYAQWLGIYRFVRTSAPVRVQRRLTAPPERRRNP
jgi:23S rRNA (adenine-N6)-dimethyltransferase